MNYKPDSDKEPATTRTIAFLLLGAAFILYPLLRLQHLGHLLTWDEAMNICSVRALSSLGNDDFSNWFWRHPPLYSMITLILAPLKDGFINRIELLNIALGSVNLLLLYILNKKLFGLMVAATSVFLLSIMPGSIFFDLWIKRDHLAITFGLLSLCSLANRKYAFSALAAGLGLLCKETFAFLYIPIFLITLLERSDKPSRPIRVALITIIPVLTSCWWFVIASRHGALSSIGDHFSFALASGTAWSGRLSFYPALLGELIGGPGILLLVAGILVAAASIRTFGAKVLAWPLLFLIIPLLFLSAIPRKVPWIVIVLLPGLATAQAFAATAVLEKLGAPQRNRVVAIASAVIAACLLALPAFNHSHEMMLRQVSPDQYRGATRSRSIAQSANQLVTDNDRVLLTSFHYWKGVVPGQACPVFTYYFERRPSVMVVPHEAPFEVMVQLISEYELNWAIVSPAPGDAEKDVLGGFISDAGLTPANMGSYACIFNTTELLSEPQSAVLDEIPEPLE